MLLLWQMLFVKWDFVKNGKVKINKNFVLAVECGVLLNLNLRLY
jgi:hypothetical protein